MMWAQLAHKFHSCIWAWVDLGDSPVAHRAANLVDRLTSKKKKSGGQWDDGEDGGGGGIDGNQT
jgi:hypothetical protein